MIIFVDGINKKEVLKRAKGLSKGLCNTPDRIDIINMNGIGTFTDYLREIENSCGETKIFINGIIADQAESFLKKETPKLSNNEIIAICSLIQNNGFAVYCVDDDVDYMFEQADSYSDLEEFREKLRAYNISAGAMKTLLPVVPMTYRNEVSE